MNRVKASLSHFLLSLLAFTTITLILRNIWYPDPHFSASGGWQGLKIIAGIDLILGPLLTLIVFNIKKPRQELISDLSIIILLQLSALIWGIHTIYQQRPIAIVFWEKEFLSVPASALSKQGIDTHQLNTFSNQTPPLVYAEKPIMIAGINKMLEAVNQQQIPPHHQTDLYRPLFEHFTDIQPFQVDIDEIITTNSQMKRDLENILETRQSKTNDYEYYPLKSRYRNIILIFTPSGELVDHLLVPLRK